MDEASWAALAAALTAVGAAWTWYAFRRRGAASGLRGAGLTLLAPAAWATGTLEVAGEVVSSVTDWATGLVLSPLVWVGIVLAGLSVLLLGTSAVLRRRGRGGPPASAAAVGRDDRRARSLPRSEQRGEPAIDDDLADIEAILKKRGIT